MKRILLDECLPVKLTYRFQEASSEFSVSSVSGEGWSGIKNGELLSRAESRFDVFLTNDQDLPYQQNIETFDIAVLIFKISSNRYADLVHFVDAAARQIRRMKPGNYYEIAMDDL